MSENIIRNADFPDEIIADILSRLPVKSILQFRCVSKHWERLISDPHFKKSHLKKSKTLSSHHRILIPISPLLSLNYNASPTDTNSSVHLDFRLTNSVKILGSCNGLVCLIDGRKEITIFNPATRRHFKPFQSHQQALNRIESVYGFGCGSNPNDVRLVRFPRFARDSDHVKFKSYDFIDTIGTFFNGFLHWLAYYSNTDNGNRVIAAFDVSKETFKDILLPPKKPNDPFYMLGVINGCLSALCDGVQFVNVELWLMKEYGVVNSWSKFVKIPVDMGIGDISFMRPLGSVNEDEILLEVDLQSFAIYNRKQNMFRDVKSVPNQTWFGDAVVYVETLLAPQVLCVLY